MPMKSSIDAANIFGDITRMKTLTCFPLFTYRESSIKLYRDFYLFYYKWKTIKYLD